MSRYETDASRTCAHVRTHTPTHIPLPHCPCDDASGTSEYNPKPWTLPGPDHIAARRLAPFVSRPPTKKRRYSHGSRPYKVTVTTFKCCSIMFLESYPDRITHISLCYLQRLPMIPCRRKKCIFNTGTIILCRLFRRRMTQEKLVDSTHERIRQRQAIRGKDMSRVLPR